MSRRNASRKGPSIVRKSVLSLAAMAAAPTFLPHVSRAALLTWDNNGNTAPNPQDGAGNWDTTSLNWFDGTNNVSWDNALLNTAVFGAGGTGGAVAVGNITIGGLTLNAAGYTLSGGGLTVSGATTITANQTGTITSNILGAGPITLSAAPGMTLNWETSSNAATGGMLLTGGGTVDLRLNAATAGLGSSAELNNVTLKFNDGRTNTTAFSVATGNTASITLAANGTLSGALTGGGVFNLSSVGTGTNRVISLQGNNTAFAGTINVGASAFLRLTTTNGGSALAVYDLGANAGSIGCRVNPGTIQLGALLGTSTTSVLRGSTGSGTAGMIWEIGGHGSVDSSFMGSIQNGDSAVRTAGLSKIGANRTLSLGGVSTYTGPTFVNAGTLELLSGASIATTPVIMVNNTGTLNVTNNSFSVANGQRLSGNNGVIAGNVTVPAGASVNPGDIGAVSTLSFSNNLDLSGGELRFDLGSGTVDSVNVTGGLGLNSGTLFIQPLGSLATGTYTLATFNAASLAGSVSNVNLIFGQRANGSVNTTTPGQLQLQINSVGTTATLNWNGTSSGTWNLSGEQNWFNTNTAQQDGFFTGDTVNFLDGAGLVTTVVKSGLLLPAAVNINTNTQAYDIGGAGTIGGSAAVTKDGSSTVTFSSVNTYTGGTTINNGTVVVSNSNGLGTGAILLHGSNAALMMSGSGVTLGNGTINAINIDADNAIIGGNGTINSVIQTLVSNVRISLPTTGTTTSINGQSITNNTAGPLKLTVTDASTGALRFTAASTTYGAIDWDMGNSSTQMFIRNGGTSISLGSIGGGPNTSLRGAASAAGAATFTIGGGPTNSTTYSGIVADGTFSGGGTLSIIKSNGTLALNGNDTYTGTTVVNTGGTLIVNGAHTGGGAYTVNGALGGKGVISAAVSVAGGGTLLPGASVGVLSVGSLALAGGSGINAEFGSGGGDGIIVTNDNGATAAATVNVNLSDAGGAIAGQYPLIDFGGTGPSAASFVLNGSVGGLSASLADNVAGSSVDVILTGGGPVHAMWNVNGNGDWSTGGNWSPSSPNGTDFQAYFGSIASGPIAVNVDAPKTVSRIHFNSTSSYTLSGSAITLDSSSGQAAINDLRGSHTIASPVVMNQDTTMHAAGLTDTLTISGNISGASGKGITKTGSGVLVLSGTNSYTGTTTVSSGKLLLNGTHTGGGAYSVASQATIGGTGVTDSAVNVAAGGIVAPGASVGVLTVGSLSLSTSRLSYEIDGTGTDRVNVTNSGGLTLAGVSTFTIANLGGMAAGTYTLIDYAGTALASLSNFNLSATTLGGFSISLVNNQANTSIDLSVIPQTITASWNVNADGNWSLGTNWTGGTAPNGVDHSATFGSVITAAHVVTVDAPQTVGTVIFDNTTAGYTIAGTSTLTLDVSTGQAAITVNNGSHVISAPIVLNDNTTITSATGTGVAITGNVTGTGRTITKAGAGTVQFENVRASNLSVSAGSAKISTKGTANSAAGTSVVQSLSISTGANLDLANNSMIVDYTGAVGTQVTDIRGHLSSGRMTTSSGTATTRLGYGDNAVLNKSTFAGQSVDTSSILVKYTYAGDADLDGDADGVDIGTWATNFTGELGGTGSMVWTQGDWDYDGDVDGVDAGLWAQAFTGELGGAGLGSLVVDDPNIAPGAAAILRGMGITVVPEPSTIGLLAGLGAMALNRRNRRRK